GSRRRGGVGSGRRTAGGGAGTGGLRRGGPFHLSDQLFSRPHPVSGPAHPVLGEFSGPGGMVVVPSTPPGTAPAPGGEVPFARVSPDAARGGHRRCGGRRRRLVCPLHAGE